MHMMAEINRILKPGGYLVLNTPNICSMKAVWAVLHGEHPGLYQQFIRPVHGYTDPRHAREYAPGEMAKLLQAAGLELKNLETGPYGLEPAPVDGSVMKLLTEKGLDTTLRGETMHVLGQKVGPVTDRYPKWLYD
jgi:pyruvate/oxaloacetate carboxyltransferase